MPRFVLSTWVHARCDASHAVLHKNLRCEAICERIFRAARLLTVAKARGRREQGPGVLATRWGGRRRGLCLVGRVLLDDRVHDGRLRSPAEFSPLSAGPSSRGTSFSEALGLAVPAGPTNRRSRGPPKRVGATMWSHRRANEAPLTDAKTRGRHHVVPPPGRRSAAPEGRRGPPNAWDPRSGRRRSAAVQRRRLLLDAERAAGGGSHFF